MKNLDKLLEIYFSFRNTSETYDEKYKWDILKASNEYYNKAGKDNLIEFAQFILKKNINLLSQYEMMDLKDLITKTPDGLRELLLILYKDNNPIAIRIDSAIEFAKKNIRKSWN